MLHMSLPHSTLRTLHITHCRSAIIINTRLISQQIHSYISCSCQMHTWFNTLKCFITFLTLVTWPTRRLTFAGLLLYGLMNYSIRLLCSSRLRNIAHMLRQLYYLSALRFLYFMIRFVAPFSLCSPKIDDRASFIMISLYIFHYFSRMLLSSSLLTASFPSTDALASDFGMIAFRLHCTARIV